MGRLRSTRAAPGRLAPLYAGFVTPGGRVGQGASWRTLGLCGLLSLSSSACFFFDSRWGEEKRSQQRNAQHAAPATLAASRGEDDGAPLATRVFKVRVYATARHAAEVSEWQHRIEDALRDASQVLGPTLGVRLELAGAEVWATSTTDEDLSNMLDQLVSTDAARDSDRVIGLVGSVPRFELSFHELGMGRILGKHLVLRAMNDAREYEAIQRSFDELEESERVKLYRSRRRHKVAAVLLHELGHNFGLPHEVERTSVMFKSYDPKASGYGAAAVGGMRMALAREVDPKSSPDDQFATAFIAHLRQTSAAWVDADRDAMIQKLEVVRASARPTAGPSGATSAANRTAAAPASEKRFGAPEEAKPRREPAIAAEQRATYQRAHQLLAEGQVEEAWKTGEPLFSTYPDDYAVQDLRCAIAMKRSGAWASVQRECEPLMRLARPPAGKSRK